ncbi:MAG: alpha/beta hydrolase [Pseudomonadota bacterium]
MTWTTRPRSDSHGLAVIEDGSGPQVLLLHGVGLRAEAWNAQIDALAKSYHVSAPDLPGHGKSPLTGQLSKLSDYTDVVKRVVMGPVLVVGHSMGAMIALDLAARYPGKVQAVAALNAVFERSAVAAKAVQRRASDLDGVTPTDPSGTLNRWFGNATGPERTACERWLHDVDPAGYRMAYSQFACSAVPDKRALTDLACPALFLTGAQDPNSTPQMSEAMARIVPQGRAHVVDGAAHMLPMTHADEIAKILSAFAQEVWS